jgi:hypothetical protein
MSRTEGIREHDFDSMRQDQGNSLTFVPLVDAMSDLNQIPQALERLVIEEGQRIVFWNDPDEEFQACL